MRQIEVRHQQLLSADSIDSRAQRTRLTWSGLINRTGVSFFDYTFYVELPHHAPESGEHSLLR